jgi:GR25 family glycosyltransferase involved in LPS biosynthesis
MISCSGMSGLVDKVYCLTLPRCTRRQRHAVSQLSGLGLEDFEFFTATNSEDKLVKEFYRKDLVHQFPPCFRCGKNSCGSDTCNNFLIPAQVATFISYSRLWKKIIDDGAGIALIVEDDVVFTDYAADVLDKVFSVDVAEQYNLDPDAEWLIRMGWARCEDHAMNDAPMLVPGKVKMSNPCHIISRGMARRLLHDFRKVLTTVDIYIHYDIGVQVRNYTLMPPIAYDLSWSVGAVDSLIHPNPIRIHYLQEQGGGNER